MPEIDFFGTHWWVTALLVGIGIPMLGLIHFAAAALAERNRPYWRSLLEGVGTFAISAGVGYAIIQWAAGMVDTDMESGFTKYHSLGVFLSIVASWVVGSFVYSATLMGKVGAGIKMSGIEMLLRVLMLALVAGIVSVVAASSQVAVDADGRKLLWIIFGSVAGLIAIALAIFFAGNLRSGAARG